ncbi:unnamed protein product [Phytophthora fragariaefolia]|uniref:Unnamed protein product n=1 Tax=Phytophthora fragariaefolia TaxID=1490495 RepID=A0A9W6WKJ2_9STRA|nr:unnamed protein product [Phytophthora fragariaefolia]
MIIYSLTRSMFSAAGLASRFSKTSSTPHTIQCHEVAALAVAFAVSVAADDDHPYYCDSDSYCEKNYPGTVCISVNNYGEVISKCTPNTAKCPACRGAQPGLCPSYQSSDLGYLNAHCVFVSEENLSLSSSGSDSGRRRLNSAASSSAATANSTTLSSTSSSSQTSSTGNSSSFTTSSSSDADALYTATIDGEEVTGQFVCLDVSNCESKAADPSTCYPSACGSSNSKEQCTYQGTCTYKNKKKITKRTCMCYAGFEGDMCSTEVSSACDVDCGTGGDCVDGECVCKEGFDGKEYDGKQGKANERCTRCTNDLACQYNNTCNTDTGKCICAPGYGGDTCGAVEDACTTTECGEGDCQVLTNGSAACYCPSCSPSCTLCDMLSNYTFDCSTCPTDSSATF